MEIKPTVYVGTTVVSYLTSQPSNDAIISARQEATRQLWNDYFDNFEFMVSDIVVTEIERGDIREAQRRLKAIVSLTTLETSPEEEIQMKEKPDPPTDRVLEECYRMKAEFAAQFNSMAELSAHLKEINKREKARGRKYIPAPPPPPDFFENIENVREKLGIIGIHEDKVSNE